MNAHLSDVGSLFSVIGYDYDGWRSDVLNTLGARFHDASIVFAIINLIWKRYCWIDFRATFEKVPPGLIHIGWRFGHALCWSPQALKHSIALDRLPTRVKQDGRYSSDDRRERKIFPLIMLTGEILMLTSFQAIYRQIFLYLWIFQKRGYQKKGTMIFMI